jgi:hypothetical protein
MEIQLYISNTYCIRSLDYLLAPPMHRSFNAKNFPDEFQKYYGNLLINNGKMKYYENLLLLIVHSNIRPLIAHFTSWYARLRR